MWLTPHMHLDITEPHGPYRAACLRSRKRGGFARKNRYQQKEHQHQQQEPLGLRLQLQRLPLPPPRTLLLPVKCWSTAWARLPPPLQLSSQRKQQQEQSNPRRHLKNPSCRGPSPGTNRRRNFVLCKSGGRGAGFAAVLGGFEARGG
jgi:hypothetical protein